MKKNAVLVIDPLSSSEYLVNRCNANGYEVIALQTIEDATNDYFDYGHLPFITIKASLNVERDVEAINQMKDQYNIVAGFYGIGSSVIYADQILSRLFPQTSNSSKSSLVRSNKFEMIKAVNDIDLGIKQIHLDNLSIEEMIDKVISFYTTCNQNIIIKPSEGSAGTYGVYIPKSEDDIIRYFSDSHSKQLFTSNNKFVVQEKLNIVTEYYVNVSSYKDHHIVAGIGKYDRSNKEDINYHGSENINILDTKIEKLKDTAIKVLNKLGMKNGLSHLEIAEIDNGSYKLVELNPRIAGQHGFISMMEKDSYGYDQVDVFLELLDNDKFNLSSFSDKYRRTVILNKKLPNDVKNRLVSLKSFYESSNNNDSDSAEDQDRASLVDLSGLLYLESKDNKNILEDMKLLEKYL